MTSPNFMKTAYKHDALEFTTDNETLLFNVAAETQAVKHALLAL